MKGSRISGDGPGFVVRGPGFEVKGPGFLEVVQVFDINFPSVFF